MRPVFAFITKAELESRNGLPLVNGIFVTRVGLGDRTGFDRCISAGKQRVRVWHRCVVPIGVIYFLYRLYLFSRCVGIQRNFVTVLFLAILFLLLSPF